jgi:membrane associated rhomboid family serine protease
MQFLSGVVSLREAGTSGGIAWWAHVGGFLLGLLLARIMMPRSRPVYSDY